MALALQSGGFLLAKITQYFIKNVLMKKNFVTTFHFNHRDVLFFRRDEVQKTSTCRFPTANIAAFQNSEALRKYDERWVMSNGC